MGHTLTAAVTAGRVRREGLVAGERVGLHGRRGWRGGRQIGCVAAVANGAEGLVAEQYCCTPSPHYCSISAATPAVSTTHTAPDTMTPPLSTHPHTPSPSHTCSPFMSFPPKKGLMSQAAPTTLPPPPSPLSPPVSECLPPRTHPHPCTPLILEPPLPLPRPLPLLLQPPPQRLHQPG